jgi:hypothetical protein
MCLGKTEVGNFPEGTPNTVLPEIKGLWRC